MTRTLYSVDLFAGCGGLSLGLHRAGFETLLFSEISKDAADTFRANLATSSTIQCGEAAELSKSRLRELAGLWREQGKEVDLVCGGPPCQGYSTLGRRRLHRVDHAEVPANHLYWSMVEVIRTLKPKLFLFENVRGLLSGRWRPSGENGEIWADVRSGFLSLREYQVGWKLVHAKDYGVPQNRPRILLVGAHRDLGLDLDDPCPENLTNNSRGLIPEGDLKPPNLCDVLSDLIDPTFEPGMKVTIKYPSAPKSEFQRSMRFMRAGGVLGDDEQLTEQVYSRHSVRTQNRFTHMLRSGGEIPRHLRSRKFSLRLLPKKWGADGPNITVTSLPDDFVHYSQPRILTVREWARLQMFPDWYSFHGPRTTGGHRRAGQPSNGVWDRTIPKYTQIGNAVPVGLAQAVGEHLARLLG